MILALEVSLLFKITYFRERKKTLEILFSIIAEETIFI